MRQREKGEGGRRAKVVQGSRVERLAEGQREQGGRVYGDREGQRALWRKPGGRRVEGEERGKKNKGRGWRETRRGREE